MSSSTEPPTSAADRGLTHAHRSHCQPHGGGRHPRGPTPNRSPRDDSHRERPQADGPSRCMGQVGRGPARLLARGCGVARPSPTSSVVGGPSC
uniref:Uncharacterized protein n=1 Tax=uncultured marine virus TaxID=186617 RepID=A0A0F7L6U8_9VIRU|nr:hypothetical protein [uncultured marine virus]